VNQTNPTTTPQILTGYRALVNDAQRQKQDVDFGYGWENQHPGDKWRVSWSQKTGELYACQPHTDRYMVLAVIPTRAEVDQKMAGWASPESPLFHNLPLLIQHLT